MTTGRQYGGNNSGGDGGSSDDGGDDYEESLQCLNLVPPTRLN